MKFPLLFTLIFLISSWGDLLLSQDVELILSVEETECTSNEDFDIFFTVNNWEDVGGVSGTIEWDETELEFKTFEESFPSMGSFLIDTGQISIGYLTFNWFNAEGTDLPNGSTVMTISFQLVSPGNEGFHEVNFSNSPTEMEVIKIDNSFNVFAADFETFDGGVETINNETPDLECIPNFSLELDENGEATLDPNDLVLSVSIACGTVDLAASQSEFDCEDLGVSTVIVTATGSNGNTATCNVQLTVFSDDDPNLECVASFTVELDENGNATIDPDDLVISASAVCGEVELSADITSFDCDDIGTVDVTITTTAENDNTAQCVVDVNVQFNQAPDLSCIDDITVTLDGNSEFSIDPNELVDFVSIACGTVDISANPVDFDCDDIGDNTVTVTATASNGESATCQLIVTVVSDDEPDLECIPNFSLELDENGEATLDPNDLVLSVSIACGTVDLAASQTEFDCDDLGVSTVIVTATGSNGNTATCNVQLTAFSDDDPNLECVASFTVELDENGDATIDPDDLVISASAVCGEVELSADITSFDCDDIGTVDVTITTTAENDNTAQCIVDVNVQFNQAPDLSCIDDITVTLDGDGEFSIDPNELVDFVSIACGTVDISANPIDFDCDDIGDNTVTVTATASNGQSANCQLMVTVTSDDEPDLECVPNFSLELDENGEATLDPNDLVLSVSIACGTVDLAASQTEFDCDDLGVSTVIVTATGSNGNTATCNVQLTVFSDDDPQLECVASFTVELDENGEATIDPDDLVISASAVCGEVELSADITSFDCDDIGTVDVTITTTAENDNTAQCIVDVNVQFNQAPDLSCIDDITVTLDGDGEFSIDPNELVDFVSIACGTVDISANPIDFDCDDIGDNTVTVTATASNGQSANCQLIVTVTSDDEPDLECIPNFSLELDENGEATLDPNDLVLSVSIACGIVDLAASQTEFDCDDLGNSTVVVTATANNGNIATCNAQLTVFSDDDPNLECVASFTVELDENGEATIDPDDLVFSASAVCGEVEISSDISSFDCDDIGTVGVTITTTAENDNTAQCIVDVNVQFNQAPDLSCIDDITVTLDGDGEFSIDPNELVDFVSIACGTVDISANPIDFDCDDIGDNTVTVTATASNGESATCQLIVTVVSDDEPDLECIPNFSLELDENGEANLDPDDLVLSVSIACGTVDLAASQTEFDCDDLGVSTVIVTATGSNENTAQCEIAITLEDNQSPTIECQDVEYFLEEGSSLIINLSDAIVTLEDNCQLEIEEPLEIELGCTALGENLFELTAIDQGGNSSICTFNLTFTDSLDLCNQLSISGQLLTKDGLPIGLGEVFLFTNGLSSDFQTTSSDGQFEFQGLAFGSNQLIEPIKHINPMNGVTTWDIVLVQAHILGLRLLNSPYQLIAADVRPDGTLNVLDLIDMRNLILGRTNRFPFNQSWKLINSEQNLPTGLLQPTHPDDLETIREYLDLNESINDANFIGVKIGDVNNSNDPSNLRNSEDRADSKETVSLNTNLNDLQNKVKLDFFTDEKITPLGMQFAFKFDPNKLEFKDWKKGILPELQLENFNFQRLEDGIILLSWNSFMEYSNYKAAPLFSFYFRKKSINGGTPDFSFCDQHLSPEVVIDLDNSKPLSFTGNKQAIANPISQLEVRPNPFSSAVEILFLTESPSKVTLGIYDDLGQHLFTKTVSTLLGRNSIRLEEDKFQNSGIYHFRLQSENAVEYGRLIFIKSN